jgi:hypothetical protein
MRSRTEFLAKAATDACERIAHARQIALDESKTSTSSPFMRIWCALTIEEQTARWAQAAALLARCEMTLTERCMR